MPLGSRGPEKVFRRFGSQNCFQERYDKNVRLVKFPLFPPLRYGNLSKDYHLIITQQIFLT